MSDLQKLIQGKIKTVSRMCSFQFFKNSSFFALREACSLYVVMVINAATVQDWSVPRQYLVIHKEMKPQFMESLWV